jgi:hypothetical protein
MMTMMTINASSLRFAQVSQRGCSIRLILNLAPPALSFALTHAPMRNKKKNTKTTKHRVPKKTKKQTEEQKDKRYHKLTEIAANPNTRFPYKSFIVITASKHIPCQLFIS